jgi:hypothetical protein
MKLLWFHICINKAVQFRASLPKAPHTISSFLLFYITFRDPTHMASSSTLKMGTADSSKMLVPIYQTTGYYISYSCSLVWELQMSQVLYALTQLVIVHVHHFLSMCSLFFHSAVHFSHHFLRMFKCMVHVHFTSHFTCPR